MNEDLMTLLEDASNLAAQRWETRSRDYNSLLARDDDDWKMLQKVCTTFADKINQTGLASINVTSSALRAHPGKDRTSGHILFDLSSPYATSFQIRVDVDLLYNKVSIFGNDSSRAPGPYAAMLAKFFDKLRDELSLTNKAS